jgi:hypothetical protein
MSHDKFPQQKYNINHQIIKQATLIAVNNN